MEHTKTIQVIGAGCKKCQKQLEIVKKTLAELGKTDQYNVEYITDIDKIADIGIFLTPAVKIDGKTIAEGRLIYSKDLEQHL